MRISFNSSFFFGKETGKITNLYNTGRNSIGSKIRSWHGEIENPADEKEAIAHLKKLKCTCIEVRE